jgi:hypothetical protein
MSNELIIEAAQDVVPKSQRTGQVDQMDGKVVLVRSTTFLTFEYFSDASLGLFDNSTPSPVLEADCHHGQLTSRQIMLTVDADMRSTYVDLLIWEMEVMKGIHLVVTRRAGDMAFLQVRAFHLHPDGKNVPKITDVLPVVRLQDSRSSTGRLIEAGDGADERRGDFEFREQQAECRRGDLHLLRILGDIRDV